MSLREHLRTGLFWYRASVIALLLYGIDELRDIHETADAARVNAARAMERAKDASDNAEQAYSEAADAVLALRNCRR